MYCLLCHRKISAWRRLKTGSEFCCDEHLEQHKKETVGRLLEYRDTPSSVAAEDPIHRLGAIGADVPAPEEGLRGSQLQPFRGLEIRRYTLPRRSIAEALEQVVVIPPGLRLAAAPDPLATWHSMSPAVAHWAARRGSKDQTSPPAQPDRAERVPPFEGGSMAEPLPAAPALLDPGLPSRLSPVWQQPSGGDLPLRAVAAAELQALTAARAPLVKSGLQSVRAADDFIPVSVSLPAGSAAPALVSGQIQRAPFVACHDVPPALEMVAFAPSRKQPVAFCEPASEPRVHDAKPWRPASLESWSNRVELSLHVPPAPTLRKLREPSPLPGVLRSNRSSAGPAMPQPELLIPVRSAALGPRDRAETVRVERLRHTALRAAVLPSAGFVYHPLGFRNTAVAAGWIAPDCSPKRSIARVPANAALEHLAPIARPIRVPTFQVQLDRQPLSGATLRARRRKKESDTAGWIWLAPSAGFGRALVPAHRDPVLLPPPTAAHLPVRSSIRSRPAVFIKMRPAAKPAPTELIPAEGVINGLHNCEALAPETIPVAPPPPYKAVPVRTISRPEAPPVEKPLPAPVEPVRPARRRQDSLAFHLPSAQPRTEPVAAQSMVTGRAEKPPSLPVHELEPVERIDAVLDPLPKLPKPLKPPLPKPRPETLPPQQRPPMEERSVREALEQTQRTPTGRSRRLSRQAVVAWHEVVWPALSGRVGKAGLASAAALIVLPLALHLVKSPLNNAANSVFAPLRERAFFLLEEDFRADFNAWTDPGLLARREDGLVEVKEGLVLYKPSLTRVDYEFSFDGVIRRGSLNWVVRASDVKNYYSFKLTRQGRGKEKRSVLIRAAVLDGETAFPEKRHVSTMPFELEENKMYKITVRVNGDHITTMIDGRGVDVYSDSKLKLGGIGFFAETSEDGLIHSLSLSGNDDTQGRALHWLGDFYRFMSSKF